MKVYIVVSLMTIHNQLISSQVLRQPFSLINRQVGEKIIEPGKFIGPPQPTVINEPPSNSIVPIPNTVTTPSTTIITDCSPAICQNLANTIQLMIVCNLLQNSRSSDLALQLAGPILNEAMLLGSTLSCGCNQFSSSALPTNVISPSVISPNMISPNVVAPNVAFPNLPPNVYSPNIVVASTNGCPCNNVVPVNSIGPNLPLAAGPANANMLLSTIMNMLGSIQG